MEGALIEPDIGNPINNQLSESVNDFDFCSDFLSSHSGYDRLFGRKDRKENIFSPKIEFRLRKKKSLDVAMIGF